MREFTGMSVSRDVTGKTKEALSTMATTASYLFFCPELIKTVLRHPSPDSHLYFSLHPKLFFADSKGRDENKQIFAMFKPFNPFVSFGKVFWLAGSLLIIGLASVVNPTIGWRWLIRIASIPGIILIMVFKVGRTSPHFPQPLTWHLPSHQEASPFIFSENCSFPGSA